MLLARSGSRWHPEHYFCPGLSKARNCWTQPAWLCPDIRGKLQLEAAAAGREYAVRRMRSHLLSWTLALQHWQPHNIAVLALSRRARVAVQFNDAALV